jgi:hypothetical protein
VKLVATSQSFPSAVIDVGLKQPVEVTLIAQLGPGAGDALIAGTSQRQRFHAHFRDELDEPSTRLHGIAPQGEDFSSLYSFVVGDKGHPFHRHAGPRIFTAIAGSAGAQLRFCGLDAEVAASRPDEFIGAIACINVPPDALFTVRFGGSTWHQFVPLSGDHAALFALSCHTNEMAGALSVAERDLVLRGEASIPGLTEVAPAALLRALADHDFARHPARTLSLTAPTFSLAGRGCAAIRRQLGRLRQTLTRQVLGFVESSAPQRLVEPVEVPFDSLQRRQFEGRAHHDDCFRVRIDADELTARSPSALLAAVLEAFLDHRPMVVSQLMRLRNFLVRPLGLRTSPLGCPVSSLLSESCVCRFAGRFPVHDKRIDDHCAEVILGADDKHLQFRSSVSVRFLPDGSASVTLGTRVVTRNAFGRFYMAVIDRIHRGYVTPSLLRSAVDGALDAQRLGARPVEWSSPSR